MRVMDVEPSKKWVKRAPLLKLAQKTPKMAFGCCENSCLSMQMLSKTSRHVRNDAMRSTFTAMGLGVTSAEKPYVLREHFRCDKYC
jgi:hypothetical protein